MLVHLFAKQLQQRQPSVDGADKNFLILAMWLMINGKRDSTDILARPQMDKIFGCLELELMVLADDGCPSTVVKR